jgi:Uncharacterized conserved protein (DUF2285)
MMNTYTVRRRTFPSYNPDWHQPYDLDEWSDEAIAFEFLRRNPDYWELVKQYYSLPDDVFAWPRDSLEVACRKSPDYSKLLARYYCPSDKYPPLSAEAVHQLQTELDHARRLTGLAWDRFGISRWHDPRHPAIDAWSLWTLEASLSARYTVAIAVSDLEESFAYRFMRPPKTTVTIDLLADGPIESQVDYVRFILQRARKTMDLDHRRAPRLPKTRNKFAEYLRLLDARDEGASYSLIARHLYGHKSAAIDLVRKRYAAAKKLRDGGYRDLLLWGKIEVPFTELRLRDLEQSFMRDLERRSIRRSGI